MKNLTWKILLLISILVFSIISIFNTSLEIKLIVFIIFASFLISSFSKSKKLTLILFMILILLTGFLIYSSTVNTGVLISSVELNSTSFESGLRQGQIINSIDGKIVNNINDYSEIIQNKFPLEQSTKTIIKTSQKEIILFSKNAPNITVSAIPLTNLKTGLDLAGGSRAIITAENMELSNRQVNDLTSVLDNRLNVYGISDVNIRPVSDLSGNNFVLIEIAGATPEDLENLISNQGKFEAKIGNKTVFSGGEKDISSIGRNAQESRIESCRQSEEGYVCRFSFSVFLSAKAAEKHAEITKNLVINSTNPQYLSKKLDLYLDDKLIDSLFIGKDLQGRVTTQISISGSGTGENQEQAYNNAEQEMNKLQTILITGSLPYKLEILKLDTISPSLGQNFVNSIFIAACAALIGVALVVFARYRNFKSSIALLITSFSEIVIILGVASMIEWNLDLPSIAGILATIGTGIDQQIIILDEAKYGRELSIKQKLKRAFSIILGAYFTAIVAMLPLLWAGAGLLKGFAITTIIGISVGVLITRPAFIDMIKNIGN